MSSVLELPLRIIPGKAIWVFNLFTKPIIVGGLSLVDCFRECNHEQDVAYDASQRPYLFNGLKHLLCNEVYG